MKTLNLKSALIIAACFLTLSLNAQNTKEIKMVNYTVSSVNKSNNLFTNTLTAINEELMLQANKLASLFKYVPSKSETLVYTEDMSASDMNIYTLTKEMELQVKFNPQDAYIPDYTENTKTLDQLTEEISKEVKFYPNSGN